MSFDPCNYPLKIRESIKTLIPKMEVHLRMWGSFLHIFLHSREHEMWFLGFIFWLAPLQAFASVVSPRLRLWLLVVLFLYVKFRIFDKPALKEYVFQANEGPHLF